MSKSKRKPVLQDHKKKKRRLIPPLLAALGENHSTYSWAVEMVPEFIWISLLIDSLGAKLGTELANKFSLLASNIYPKEPKPLFASMSSFLDLTGVDKEAILANLEPSMKTQLCHSLNPLNTLCEDQSLSFLYHDKLASKSETSKDFPNLLERLYDRFSKVSVLTMATTQYCGLTQGKIILVENLADKVKNDFRQIVDYPKTEASKAAGASFRAASAMFTYGWKDDDSEGHENWLQYFWEQVAGFGSCKQAETINTNEPVPEDPFGKIVISFRNASKKDLKERLDNWGFDLNNIEGYEVVGALLARQTTLAIDLASAPNIWTPHTAPLILRAMADVHIAMVWLFGDLPSRAKQFVDDGLGVIKLEIEHRKREQLDAKECGDVGDYQNRIDYLESWINSQRIYDLVEVNLGSWSGLTTRKMAEEADCLDFYNYVFQPFSSAVHSNWAHVSQFNTIYCENPAHRFHKLPVTLDLKPDPYWLYLAAKYHSKSLREFDKKFGFFTDSQSAFELLLKDLYGEGGVGEKK